MPFGKAKTTKKKLPKIDITKPPVPVPVFCPKLGCPKTIHTRHQVEGGLCPCGKRRIILT